MSMSRVLDEYVRLNTIDKERTGEWNAVYTSILFVPIVDILYLIFVLYLGPKFMKNRRPFSLFTLLQGYNCFQAIFNAYLFVQWTQFVWLRRGSLRCIAVVQPGTSDFDETVNLMWITIANRMVDMLESVFHVLRKKYVQNSFLHVYHHVIAFSGGWYVARYHTGGGLAFFIAGNTFIHVLMYTYYFASTHSSLRLYAVRYKERITQIQLLQFIIIATYTIYFLTDQNCHSYPKWLVWFGLLQDFFFLYLFGKFYVEVYRKNKKEK